MRVRSKIAQSVLVLFLLAAGWVSLAVGAGLEPIEQDQRYFAFRLDTPALEVEWTPDGTTVKIEGFGTRTARPEAPDVPSKTVLVAVPPGCLPRLEVRPATARFVRGVIPRPVAREWVDLRHPAATALEPDVPVGERVEMLRHARRREFHRGARYYEGVGRYPEQPARISGEGVLRDQRYVQVELSPVAFDPGAGGLWVHDRLEVVVHFDGAAPADDIAPAEPVFESIYRSQLLNYDQGRAFRLKPAPRAGAAPSLLGGPVPRYEIRVDADGIYRLDHALLQSTAMIGEPLSTWVLSNRGVQVPLEIQDADSDDTLDPTDAVQFYGEALTDEPHTELDFDFPTFDDDLWADRDFTDTNVYILTVAGGGQPEMAARNSAPGGGAPPAFFTDTVHLEVDDAYRGAGPEDPWYWAPTTTLSAPTRTEMVPLPGLFVDGSTDTLQVRVRVLGRTEYFDTDPDHLTEVVLADAAAQTLATDPGAFDDRILYTHDFGWSGNGLTQPLQISFSVLPIGAGLRNDVILDSIEVDYRRSFVATGNELAFTWPDGDQVFEISGLADSTPQIYETTAGPAGEPTLPTRLTGLAVTGTNPYTVRFEMRQDPDLADGTPRRFLVLGDSAITTVAGGDFAEDVVSDLRDPSNQADIIVIAHPDVLDAGPDACAGPNPTGCLTAWRSAKAGLGLTSKVVLLDDIYDEFNFGLPGPVAIREFLRWVLSDAGGEGWAEPRPSYLVLLGDGSFDYKGGTAAGNFVPTQIVYHDEPELGYYASDNLLAAVVGADKIPDLMIGRLTAGSVAEANALLFKSLDFSENRPDGPWRRHALLISDRGKIANLPEESLAFEAVNALARLSMDIPPYTYRDLRYWSDYCDTQSDPLVCNTPAMRQAIKDAVNGDDGFDGAAAVQFIGHSSFTVWSDDAFFDERVPNNLDTDDLNNGPAGAPRLPWLLAHNCLSGGFHSSAPNTMGEGWLKREGGGAMGVFAPSGLSFSYTGENLTIDLWPRMFGGQRERNVGLLTLESLSFLCTTSQTRACENYVVLGDPTLDIAWQSVEPAADLQAVAGDASVQLTWTASATTGAVYDVYRLRFNPAAPGSSTYTKINTGDVTGTSFLDTTVVNTLIYRYYVVARDAEGFRSRWSNFNSDCDTSGPDCVEAIPLNPNPPAIPTGVAIDDPGTGGALRVTWTANVELDLAYYTVHYGPSPGLYTDTTVAGGDPSAWLFGLTEGQTYYAAVSATNTSGNTSDLSDEVSTFPVFGPGLRPPAYVDDLTLKKQGTDLVLEWSEVTTNLYGQELAVVSYEILRGTGVGFHNAGLVKIGDCPAPCTSFTDPGSATSPENHYYRVRAADGLGNLGALGSELPSGTELSIGKSASPGNLTLSWVPVTGTASGEPTQVSHYLLYASDSPFTRLDIRDGVVGSPTMVSGTDTELTPPVQNRYYSVLAVDIRGNVSPY